MKSADLKLDLRRLSPLEARPARQFLAAFSISRVNTRPTNRIPNGLAAAAGLGFASASAGALLNRRKRFSFGPLAERLDVLAHLNDERRAMRDER